ENIFGDYTEATSHVQHAVASCLFGNGQEERALQMTSSADYKFVLSNNPILHRTLLAINEDIN
ncbi:MAG: hypothetical protein MHPSP_004930, partial [Paramarteilia canceri]